MPRFRGALTICFSRIFFWHRSYSSSYPVQQFPSSGPSEKQSIGLSAATATELPVTPIGGSRLHRDVFRPGPKVRVYSWRMLWASVWPSLKFLAQTEVHVYSFAVAANVLLTFFPFLVAMVLLCQYVLHWRAAEGMIFRMVDSYFPPGFVNLHAALWQAASHVKFSWISVFLLLFTANGIFVPLEVAFNRIWQAKENRSYVRNQVISLALIFGCGALVLLSTTLATINVEFLEQTFGAGWYGAILQVVALKVAAIPISMLIIFLLYWGLPNARISVKRVIPASIAVGLLLQGSTYLNIVTWPWLHAKLLREVPPFVQSISIILWSFVATMIVLAGAEWSARVSVESLDGPPERAGSRG